MLVYEIENSIKKLKEVKNSDDKNKLFDLIASKIGRYIKQREIKHFEKSFILSFFESGFFPLRTQQRYIKNIVDKMKNKNIIADDIKNKSTLQKRIYSLKSNDYDSYKILMNKNGYNKTEYIKYEIDKNGVPRQKVVFTTDINENPKHTDYNYSRVKETTPRKKQKGVLSYGSLSVAFEKRVYTVKSYKVLI